jgi:hypothetical protein
MEVYLNNVVWYCDLMAECQNSEAVARQRLDKQVSATVNT